MAVVYALLVFIYSLLVFFLLVFVGGYIFFSFFFLVLVINAQISRVLLLLCGAIFVLFFATKTL